MTTDAPAGIPAVRVRAEALESDIRSLLDVYEIDQDQAKKRELQMLLLGIHLISESRDIRPDEDEYARERMKELE